MSLRLSPIYRSRGFTLIEVMICLVILAIGMLGMTSLQNEVVKYNQSGLIESQAMFLLNDMAERIRANKGNDAYVIAYTEMAPTQSVDCAATTCSSNEMVVWDLNQWRAKVQNTHLLPKGESQILYDSLARTFTISIRYDWSRLGSGADIVDGLRVVTITTRI